MKKLLLVASILALCVLLVLSVKAHPGRTDGNGGHTDHSTGEYHYHHGYSAHDHYDMDGDGDVDCPYNFDDQTSHKQSDKSDAVDKVPKPTSEATTSQNQNNSKANTFDYETVITIGIAVLLIGFWIAPAFFKK